MAKEVRIYGIAASPGIAIGRAFVYRKQTPLVEKRQVTDTRIEIDKFMGGLERAKSELIEIKRQIAERLGESEASLWDAQVLLLDDPSAIEATAARIRDQRQDAASAFQETMEQMIRSMEATPNQYLKERAADVRDLAWRVIKHLQYQATAIPLNIPRQAVVISHDLSPADITQLLDRKAAGFVTEAGGATSHTAIVARSLELPAVVGLKGALLGVSQDDMAIVDGIRGAVIFNPGEKTTNAYRRELRNYARRQDELKRLRKQKPVTRDGHGVELSANIELSEEMPSVKSHGAMGVGLFRTEFIYLTSNQMPSENEQSQIYRRVAEQCRPDPVIIRTFDLGGDKIGEDYQEANPFLGWRAVRYCLDRPDIFKIQLRAILRASAHGNVRIMLPMICCPDEVRRSKELLEICKRELADKGVAFDPSVKLGIMVETPAAALMANELARLVDFFSIGSNDLTQYTLAVDRTNEKVARMYEPFHPAVLRLIRDVIEAGHRAGIWVGLCGEMGADPLAVPLLLGLGIDELSVNPAAVPEVKKIIIGLRFDQCRKAAAAAMEMSDAADVRAKLKDFLCQAMPGIKLIDDSCALEIG
ncbi:MAG: phosphoenolpyruvate--protein phosphotransferase [Candidatus Edwardsbacteria bacterium]|nr:phosphoenolpyruvate--protein phosphotransferase [Candidatus Edwardsbacteria bacterium]